MLHYRSLLTGYSVYPETDRNDAGHCWTNHPSSRRRSGRQQEKTNRIKSGEEKTVESIISLKIFSIFRGSTENSVDQTVPPIVIALVAYLFCLFCFQP